MLNRTNFLSNLAVSSRVHRRPPAGGGVSPQMTKPKPKQDRPATKTFYSEQFTTDELALVAAFVADPTLDDEIWMQRVLNHRLMVHANLKDPEGEGPSTDVLIKLAEALAIG